MKVLVVDDDPAILKLCANALRAMNHEVTTCDGGQAALEAALTTTFDLALCDLNLPDVNGLEIVRAIKMNAPDLPVIVISALDPREWRPKSADAGADHFLQKPLRLDVLRNEVRMVEGSRANLSVALHDPDPVHRAKLEGVLKRGGCHVTVVDAPWQIMTDDVPPELIILDASADSTEAVVKWAAKHGVHCFVLVARGGAFEDRLMRVGASLMLQKPVDADALLIQARFLARR